MNAAEVHARISSAWPAVLQQLGIAEEFLRLKKPGPCPVCGGRDRYVFDNRRGRGDFLCRQCGAGDGFELLTRVHRWSFSEALSQVARAAGLRDSSAMLALRAAAVKPDPVPAVPTRYVRDILRNMCRPADVDSVRNYLASRMLWPLPAKCSLRAHASLPYWNHERQRLGQFPALVARVTDLDDQLVTAHVTYLSDGKKLSTHEPRKILSPMTGRVGCAVRLMPLAGDVLGIGEGIETCLSAAAIHGVPVWAALNTSLLQKFEPPEQARRLIVFADHDEAGLLAARRLVERLQGKLQVETRIATEGDWNDELVRSKDKDVTW